MFSGVTLFNDRINLVQCCFHVFAIIASSQFIMEDGHYAKLKDIWSIGGIIPLIFEIIGGFAAKI